MARHLQMTKRQYQQWLWERGSWLAAALAGTGLVLALSYIFLWAGLIILGSAALSVLAGWLISRVLPALETFHEVTCPQCKAVNLVPRAGEDFCCDWCGGSCHWQAPATTNHLKLQELRRAMLYLVVLLYITFLAESYLGHYLRLPGTRWSALLIPVVFASLAAILTCVVLWRESVWLTRLFQVAMLASVVVALLGTYYHLNSYTLARGPEGAWLADPPVLAPLTFLIPGVMGLVATWGARKDDKG